MTSTRRGFTLVEMLMAMFIFVLIGGAIYGLLIRSQRLSRGQAERGSLQDNIRTGTMILPAELHEVGYDENSGPDVILNEPGRIRFRAMRGMRIVCAFSETEVRVRNDLLFGSRGFTLQDGFFLFLENNANFSADDEWYAVTVADVDPNSTCSGTGTPSATRLTLGGSGLPSTHMGLFAIGAPLRYYEIMELSLYSADGKSWLGARSITNGETTPQPVLGPLADGNGIEFVYRNAAGSSVTSTTQADRNTIRTVEITFRGRTDTRVHKAGDGTVDYGQFDLTTRVALRNTLRP